MKVKLLNGFGKLALLFVCVFAFNLTSVFGQNVAENGVPANTVKAFKSYSKGSSASWFAGPNNSYEATWMNAGRSMVYVFDQAGELQQKKYRAALNSMPNGISSIVIAACPNGKVDGAYRVVDRANHKFYEVQISNPNAVDRMRFDLTGKPIGKTSMAIATPKPSQEAQETDNSIAMRGTSITSAVTTTQVDDANLEEVDDDIKDLFDDEEDDSDINDLLDDDENWEDVELDDDLEDDSDLLDPNDDGFDEIDLDDEDESDDGF